MQADSAIVVTARDEGERLQEAAASVKQERKQGG